ncbi:hypothetical protein N0V93_000573 [Gnomoniopsis smithogilvyi]|uniref:Uncharacterized protein n=1 Tax=Gnomoniopsis smithogilvyi TaxID=1191159 RepID=A0A9W8Z0F1_9PEZI|nr:hypothetical protein N0V93_000573 [Gnomoniopsis smithogilvyi]
MERCRHRSETPLDLIKHLIACDEAPRGTVWCEQCDESHGMTRLRSPTQLFRKVMRKRGQAHTTSLASSHGQIETAEVDRRADNLHRTSDHFESPKAVELDSLRLFEMNAIDDFELDSKQVFEMNEPRGFERTPELAVTFEESFQQGQFAKPCATKTPKLAAIESVVELETPQSTFVPSLISSSTASRQISSRKWSGASQASTLLEKSPAGYWQYSDSLDFKLQHSSSEISYPLTAASSCGIEVDAGRGSWIPGVALTMSPEEVMPTKGSHTPWTSNHSTYVHKNLVKPDYSNVIVQSPQYMARNDGHEAGFHKGPAWPPSAPVVGQPWPAASDIPSNSVLSTNKIGVNENHQIRDHGQSLGSANAMVYELDNFTTLTHDSIATLQSGLTSKIETNYPIPKSRRLMRNNALRKTTRLISKFDVVTDISNDTLRCKFPNCSYRPTGQTKNHRCHLKRHERTHIACRQRCPFPNCNKTFPIDRKDNLDAHYRSKHDKNWHPESRQGSRMSGTTISGTSGMGGNESQSSLDEPCVGDNNVVAISDRMNDTGLHGEIAALHGGFLNGISDGKETEMTNISTRDIPDDPLMEWSWNDIETAGRAHYSDLQLQIAAYADQLSMVA